MRAESPVPVAERSSRPGATTTAFRLTASTPLPRLRDLHDGNSGDLRPLRMHAGQLLARGLADQLTGRRQVARLVRLDREPQHLGIGDRVPHAAVGDVDDERPKTCDLQRCIEVRDERRNIHQFDAFDAAVATRGTHLDDTPRRLETQHRLGLDHLDEAPLEQHSRDADRVRAGHRRVLGRLHDDVPPLAVRPSGRDEQIRVSGNGAARLAQEKPAQPVVGFERLHLLEDGRTVRRRHARDDDVPDLATGVAADDGDRPTSAHRGRPYRLGERRPFVRHAP